MIGSAASSEKMWCTVQPDGSVTIPPQILAELGVSEGDTIAIDATEFGMVLRRYEPEADRPTG